MCRNLLKIYCMKPNVAKTSFQSLFHNIVYFLLLQKVKLLTEKFWKCNSFFETIEIQIRFLLKKFKHRHTIALSRPLFGQNWSTNGYLWSNCKCFPHFFLQSKIRIFYGPWCADWSLGNPDIESLKDLVMLLFVFVCCLFKTKHSIVLFLL